MDAGGRTSAGRPIRADESPSEVLSLVGDFVIPSINPSEEAVLYYPAGPLVSEISRRIGSLLPFPLGGKARPTGMTPMYHTIETSHLSVGEFHDQLDEIERLNRDVLSASVFAEEQ